MMLRLSINRACWRAALKSASSHFNSGRLFAARSRLSNSKSSRSDSLRCNGCDCTPADAKLRTANAAMKHVRNFFAEREKKLKLFLRGGATFFERKNSRVAAGRDAKVFMLMRQSAANANGAEAQHHVATSGGTAEAEHRAETRKEQHLIQLPAKVRARGAGQNLIIRHVAFRIDSDVHQKAMRQGKFDVVLLGRPGLRVIRERKDFRWPHQIDRHIVFHCSDGDARKNHLNHQSEHENCGKEAAGGRNGQRAKHVLENDFRMVLKLTEAARPIA